MSSSADRQLLGRALTHTNPAHLLDALLEWKEGTPLESALSRHGLEDLSARTLDCPATVPGLAVLASASTSGRYQKIRPHAKGGLGEVFVARDEELQREVALKEIQDHAADHPESRARFVREAEVTGNLEHPGIVAVYGLGTYPDGRPYYAMRFIRGQSLNEAIKRHHAQKQEPLALRQLLNRFVSVCNAVAFAHSRGVIHRDLKPDNVMLGDYGETLVVDWGLARVLDQEEETTLPSGWLRPSGDSDTTPTQEGAALGTPGYMPPEQAHGRLREMGPHSDIFSLGATLYAILAGRAPYKGSDALIQAAACEWKPARQIKGDIPRALEAICGKAMAQRPEDRHATARDLAADVEAWLADEPVSAYREPLWDRMRRWSRRHRTLVTTAVAVLLLSVVALTVGLGAVSAEQARTAAARDDARDAAAEARDNERRAKKAEKEAKGNLEVAEANLKLAKKAVNDTFDLAKNHKLLQQPGMQEVRKLLLEKALPFYKRFRVLKSNDAKSQWELAEQHFRVGYITSEIGNKAEARQAYEQAEAICRTLVKANPTVSAYQNTLARTLNNMGILLDDEGKRAEAMKAYAQARALREKLLKANPTASAYQNDLARTLLNLGLLRREMKQPREGLADLDLALKQLQAVLKIDPRSGQAGNLLWRVLVYRALTLTDLKRHADAAADWSRFLLVAPPPYRTLGRLHRAASLARAGRHEQAMKDAEAVGRVANLPASYHYDLACVAALCAAGDPAQPLPRREHLSEGYARQAIAWLKAAHKAGHFKLKANRDHLQKDPDLAALRQREDFKAWARTLDD